MTSDEDVRTLNVKIGPEGADITVVDSESGKTIPISGDFPSMREVIWHLVAEFCGARHIYVTGIVETVSHRRIKFTERPSWPPFDPSPFMIRRIAIEVNAGTD